MSVFPLLSQIAYIHFNYFYDYLHLPESSVDTFTLLLVEARAVKVTLIPFTYHLTYLLLCYNLIFCIYVCIYVCKIFKSYTDLLYITY